MPRAFRGAKAVLGLSLLILALLLVSYGQLQGSGYRLEGDFESFLASMRGKVLVLDVMNTACPPCRAEVPHLKEFYSRIRGSHPDRVVLVSIAIEWPFFGKEDDERIRRFQEETGADWPIFRYDDAEGLIEEFDLIGIPTLLVFDEEGQLRFKKTGITTADQLEAAVLQVLEG